MILNIAFRGVRADNRLEDLVERQLKVLEKQGIALSRANVVIDEIDDCKSCHLLLGVNGKPPADIHCVRSAADAAVMAAFEGVNKVLNGLEANREQGDGRAERAECATLHPAVLDVCSDWLTGKRPSLEGLAG